jgi:O-acetyl-ADP-ribose deacetylase (regulator of RNase III)
VVRPATTWLEPLLPALHRLDAAAGPAFSAQRRVHHELAVGSAVVTGAGELAAEYVVHVVYGEPGGTVTADAVRRATEAALWQCTQWRIVTLACPVPPDDTLEVMLEAVRAHMRNSDHPGNVLVVVASVADAESLNARIGQGGP